MFACPDIGIHSRLFGNGSKDLSDWLLQERGLMETRVIRMNVGNIWREIFSVGHLLCDRKRINRC